MEKLSSVSSRSNSPLKSARKSEQKVQFSDEAEFRLQGHKVCGKPPEVPRAPPYSRSSSRMSGSSSISSSSSSSSSSTGTRFSSAGSTNSVLDRANRSGESSRWTSSLDRKRAGSLRNKSSDRPPKCDSSRSHSLDRRRAENARRESASPVSSTSERKRRECDGKDSQSKEKKPKTKTQGPTHSRSFSGERSKLTARPKLPPPSLPQSGKGDHSKKENILEQKVLLQTEEKKSWTQRMKRAASRSPSRSLTEKSGKEDKENISNEKMLERSRELQKSLDKKERGRSLKRESRSGKNSSSGKNKHEEVMTIIGDVMWWGSGSRKTGYLLFNYANLEDPPKDCTAKKYTMSFKFSQADSKLIRMLLEAHGFSEVDHSSTFFNLYWGNAHFNPNEIRQLQDWQKVNHFPRSSELTRKDRLYMNIKRMQRQFGVKLFDFIPTSFILPTEYRDFCDTHLRERGTWIVKPVASSQGKGIYLINQVDQVPADETSLVCRYIDAPLLVDGYKCDLRLYVAVTSLDPLVVYLYEEGLVRLATVKYQHGKNLWNPCIHLTNYSVNKFHSNYVQNEDPEVDDQGNKWSLSAFLRHLKSQGIDTGIMMRSIEDVIIKSLLAASYQMNTATNMFVPHHRNCFELYGFDILVDNQLKPWVLEVNLSPSLNIDQPLDLKIKSAMLADLFSLVGIQVANPYTAKVSSRPSIFRKLPYLSSKEDLIRWSETRHLPGHEEVAQSLSRWTSDTFSGLKLASSIAIDQLQARYSTDNYERNQYGRGAPIVPSAEELRIVRQVREEYERRGGWARIYPTPDSWGLYGGLQEYDSPLNLVLHYHLYPQVPRTNRYGRVTPGRISGVSSTGLASSLERLTCYERALPKGLSFFRNKKNLSGSKKEDKVQVKDKKQVKASLMRALENGLALSKYQARMAFSVYLQHVQRRLMIGCDEEKQTDLVFRFLKSAARTLHNPLSVQNPSKTLPSEARAVVISKQLGDFIQAYNKETHIYLDQSTSASCSSLSSQCPTSVATSSEPATPHVSSPPSTSTLSINAPSSTACGQSSSNQDSENEATTSDFVSLPTSSLSVKKSKSFASVSSGPLIAKSHSSISVSSCTLMSGSRTAGSSPPSARRYSSNASISSPPSTCMSGSCTSINSPPMIAFSPSSTSINSPPSTSAMGSTTSINFPPSTSAMGSTTSINFPPPSKTPSVTSLNSITDGVELSTLPPRVRRLKSDGDAVGPIIEGDGSKMSTSLDSTDLQRQSSEDGNSPQPPQQQQQQDGQSQSQAAKDDHITMDLYRAFMSNAGESDLEEILALQTRMHNSVGVFLESNRKSRYSVGATASSPGTAPPTTSSRPRTPTASPHGSPRRCRRSPSTGSQVRQTDPVTIEPQALPSTSQPGQQSEQGCKLASSSSVSEPSATAAAATQSSTIATSTASSCCLFGNILKASLKGTHTSFIS